MPEPLPPAILKPPTGTLNGRDQTTPEFHDPEPPPVAVPSMPLEVPVMPLEAPPAAEKPRPNRTFPAAGRELRRRGKKVVEVAWVERPPTVAGFIVAVVVLALMVAGLIVAAAYLR
jgi:hypothetical protein